MIDGTLKYVYHTYKYSVYKCLIELIFCQIYEKVLLSNIVGLDLFMDKLLRNVLPWCHHNYILSNFLPLSSLK